MKSKIIKITVLASACLMALAVYSKQSDQNSEPEAGSKIVDHSDVGEASSHDASSPETAADAAVRKAYSPYTGKGPATPPENFGKSKYPSHVFFGDTHHHTANSGDAFHGRQPPDS